MEYPVRKYSIDELNQLLDSIKAASGLTEGDVMGRIKRNPGYVSQLRSRGDSVPEKLIQALKSEFKEELNKNNIKLTTVTAKPNFGDEKPVKPNDDKLVNVVVSQQDTIKMLTEALTKLIAKG